ncbi:helix-turn-helix transcriptional regulator [Paenibacillus sp. JX-17]|uniref:Helix-turn-helix transcriptional regulator n=1 Tax=Paenibacillus lacisoli TaxID=3064525 RepID=A0ABT9C9L5_9BACL|nr:helix-turn-helix transcriptional regulator [Paenibacillus sp. JX-17]MDO7905926.1 helix-turn-helix transcriptional regulator [Paenibacillus sp. JX-17]
MIELTTRHQEIIEIVRLHAPVTGEQIAEMLGLSRPTIRSDLSILVMLGLLDAKPKVGYFPGRSLRHESQLGARLRKLVVSDVQSEPVLISDEATAYDAVVALFHENTGSIMVVDARKSLTGIVTRKDLLKFTLGHADLRSIPVRLAMTRLARIVTLTPDEPVLSAAQKLVRHQVNCLPVICSTQQEAGEDGLQVIGCVTKTDIMSVLMEMMSGNEDA